MKPERSWQIEELYHAARECESGGVRAFTIVFDWAAGLKK
jgi:hypothetical protein